MSVRYELPLYSNPQDSVLSDKYGEFLWKPQWSSFFTNYLSRKNIPGWQYKCNECGWISREYADADFRLGHELVELILKDHPQHPPVLQK